LTENNHAQEGGGSRLFVLFVGVFLHCVAWNTPFFVCGKSKKGERMNCDFCQQDVPGLIKLRIYTPQGIWVCEECYKAIDSHRHKPYSKTMGKLALVEAGYPVNRKLARNHI
jgi:ribosomal protein L37AE/L43A